MLNNPKREERWMTYHVVLTTEGRQAIAVDEDTRRSVVRTLAHVAGKNLVLFNVVDDHAHLVLLGTLDMVRRLRRGLVLSLRPVASTQVRVAHAESIASRAHLSRLVPYVLTQTSHHGLAVHPAIWTGSAFVDLVGARILPGLHLQLNRVLPRLTLAEICRALHPNLKPVLEMPQEEIRTLGMNRVLQAATAVFACNLNPVDKMPNTVRARWAAANVANQAGIHPHDIAWTMGATRRSVRNWLRTTNDEAYLRAVRIRLALEERVASLVR